MSSTDAPKKVQIPKQYKLLAADVVGTVKWYDNRDGYGIIKDKQGNEHYFSSDAAPWFLYGMKNVVFDKVYIPNYGIVAFNARKP